MTEVKETSAIIENNKVYITCPHCNKKMWINIDEWEKILKIKYGKNLSDYDVRMNIKGDFNIKNKCRECSNSYRIISWEIEV